VGLHSFTSISYSITDRHARRPMLTRIVREKRNLTLFALLPQLAARAPQQCSNENVNFQIDMQRMPWHRLIPISANFTAEMQSDGCGIYDAYIPDTIHRIAGVTTVGCGKWLVNCTGHRGTRRTLEVPQGWTKGQTYLCASNKFVVPFLVRFVV